MREDIGEGQSGRGGVTKMSPGNSNGQTTLSEPDVRSTHGSNKMKNNKGGGVREGQMLGT